MRLFTLSRKWLPRILRFGVCGVYAYEGWAQIVDRPWLDSSTVVGYLQSSLFAQIYSAYQGFLPLVEIFGGFAWLAQLAGPILLLNKSFGKYWALTLLILNVLLGIVTPMTLFHWIMTIALISFLPHEWLTFKKSKLKIAWRNFCFFFLMATMCFTVFDRNIAWQFDIFERIKSKNIEVAYEIVSDPFVKLGNLILFNTLWKMYSPTWRRVVWIDWYYKATDGSLIRWPQNNFSPDYRMRRRTWLQALWTDFKEEKVFVGMLSDAQEKIVYGKFLCDEMKKAGVRPVSVHPEIYSFNIRGPDQEWSLKDQDPERKDVKEEISCD